MNHPLINFNRNIVVMSQSSTCGQEMAYNKTKDLVKSAVAPFAGVVENIRDILDRLQKFAEDLRKTYERLKKTIEEIGAAIQRAAHWVGSMADICNDKIGQPYRRCRQVFDDGENRCK
ncbi:hypothetical protein CHS0354_032071 [Potamilus streckersoni]|uniref:Uncharacterized protein n=1 Tax=Potamilus streckersoni TaxID=2493646 RepID=A0AAE0TL32_9BIVA|nr:hypothetical protein CHS0354_032071 [Potamilus streckersoni]